MTHSQSTPPCHHTGWVMLSKMISFQKSGRRLLYPLLSKDKYNHIISRFVWAHICLVSPCSYSFPIVFHNLDMYRPEVKDVCFFLCMVMIVRNRSNFLCTKTFFASQNILGQRLLSVRAFKRLVKEKNYFNPFQEQKPLL